MMSMRMNRICTLLLLLLVLPGHGFNLVIGGQEVSNGIGGNVGGYDQVRFEFEYGLPEGRAVGQSEVESLICRTQEYLTEMLHNEFQDPSLNLKATSIKWEFVKDDPLPVKVRFTTTATSNETTVPSPEEIRDSLTGLDMGAYLANYVKANECPTGFSEATEVAYEVNLTPEVDGDIAEATCQSTCAPTQTPGTPTGKPTALPTLKPTSGAPPKEAFQTEEHVNDQMRPDYTRPPSFTTLPPVSFANPAHLPPVHLATTAPGAVVADSGGGVSLSTGHNAEIKEVSSEPKEISGGGEPGSDSEPGNPASEGESNPNNSDAETGHSDMILFNLEFGFFEGEERDGEVAVDESEVKSLVCYTQDFFASELQTTLGDPEVSFKAINIDWSFDGTIFKLSFAANVTNGSDTPVPEDEVFQSLKVAKNDLHTLMVDFVSKVQPPVGRKESIFFTVNEVDLQSLQNVPIPVGKLPNGVEEPCSQYQGEKREEEGSTSHESSDENPSGAVSMSSAQRGMSGLENLSAQNDTEVAGRNLTGSEVLYSVDIGFFAGDAKLPTEMEVEALLCEFDIFFRKELQGALLNETLESEVMLVEWAYSYGAEKPVGIMFIVEALSENGAVPQGAMYKALKLDEPSVEDLIQNYIWKAEPSDSVFHNTSTVSFKAKVGVPVPSRGHATSISCPAELRNKTLADNSTKPGTNRMGGFNAPVKGLGATSSNATNTGLGGTSSNVTNTTAYEQGVSYSLVLGFYDKLDDEPRKEDIEILMCKAKTYFTKLLNGSLPHVELSMINVTWWYNEDCTTPLNVVFAMGAVLDDGTEVGPEELYGSLKLGDNEILDLIQNFVWQTGGPFSDVNQLIFEESMGTAVEVPEGEIPELSCPIEPTPDHQRGEKFTPGDTPPMQAAYQLVFGFYEGKAKEPTMMDVESMIRETNAYFENLLEESTGDPNLKAEAVQICWSYCPDCSGPVTVTFVLEARYGDGQEVPPETIVEALRLTEEELKVYLEEYVWHSEPEGGNLFYEVNQIGFENSLKEPNLQAQFAKAAGPAGSGGGQGDESPPGSSTGGDFSSAESPSSQSSSAASPSAQSAESSSAQATSAESEELTPVQSSSAQSPSVRSSSARAPSAESPSAQPPSAKSPSAQPPSAKSPSANTPSAKSPSANTPSAKSPSANTPSAKSPSASPPSAESSEAEQPPAAGTRKNAGEAATDSNEPAQSPTVKSPTVPASGENAVLFHLSFGFYNGTLSEPTPEEIEALICESQEFVKAELQKQNQGECIEEVTISKIDWTYDETCPTAPVTVTYAAQALFCDGTEVPPDLIYESMKLDEESLKLYLEAYVWDSKPTGGNVFYNANAVIIEGKTHTPVRPGKMQGVSC